jgi:hypothetical protein
MRAQTHNNSEQTSTTPLQFRKNLMKLLTVHVLWLYPRNGADLEKSNIILIATYLI